MERQEAIHAEPAEEGDNAGRVSAAGGSGCNFDQHHEGGGLKKLRGNSREVTEVQKNNRRHPDEVLEVRNSSDNVNHAEAAEEQNNDRGSTEVADQGVAARTADEGSGNKKKSVNQDVAVEATGEDGRQRRKHQNGVAKATIEVQKMNKVQDSAGSIPALSRSTSIPSNLANSANGAAAKALEAAGAEEKTATATGSGEASRKLMTSSATVGARDGRAPVLSRWPDVQANAGQSAPPLNRHRRVLSDNSITGTETDSNSVKTTVSKFGGIVDWRAHRAKILQRSESVQLQVEKLQKEITECREQLQATEEATNATLKELESTKGIIQELQISLEAVENKEAREKEDLELVELMAREMAQGVSPAAGMAYKITRDRHDAVASELQSVREELRRLLEENASMPIKKDIAVRKADAAAAAAAASRKTVEELRRVRSGVKEQLQMARAAEREAAEHRDGTAMARDQDCLTWEEELKNADEKLRLVREQMSLEAETKTQLDKSCKKLLDLKTELAAYMDATLSQDNDDDDDDEAREMQRSVQEALAASRKELAEVKPRVETAKAAIGALERAASSLQSDLAKEKGSLSAMKQMQGMAAVAVTSIEAEIAKVEEELAAVREKEKASRDKQLELPKALQRSAREADEAKLAADNAKEELKHAKDGAEEAKAGLRTTEIRLQAALKEIEAARASEQMALAVVRALVATGGVDDDGDQRSVTVSLEEYLGLSRTSGDADELALAKASESRTVAMLRDAQSEMEKRRLALQEALEKAERAKEGKMAMEQELRDWRAQNKLRRRDSDAARSDMMSPHLPSPAPTASNTAANANAVSSAVNETAAAGKTKKKPSIFPRVIMFLARKKRSSSN